MSIVQEQHPIVIIGGGVIGSAIAYFLTLQQPGCNVVVVERDPSYARASSALRLRPGQGTRPGTRSR